MPEGHTVHRLARTLRDLFGGEALRVTSPQGRFTDGAALISGRRLVEVEAWGKQLFCAFVPDGDAGGPSRRGEESGRPDGDAAAPEVLWLRTHLGLYGAWTFAGAPGAAQVAHAIGAPRKRIGERETVVPEPEPEPEPEPGSAPVPELEPGPKPEPGSAPVPGPEPASEPVPGPASGPEPASGPSPGSEPAPRTAAALMPAPASGSEAAPNPASAPVPVEAEGHVVEGRTAEGAAVVGRSVAGRGVVGRVPHRTSVPDGERVPGDGWQPPAPRGQVRVRLLGRHAVADLTGPAACEVVTPAEKDAVTARLGPDPIRDGEPGHDAERFVARVGRSRVTIGQILMDQAVIAGVGNIYRAEALFRAGVDPLLPGRDVPASSARAIWDDLVLLMREGARTGAIVTTRPEDRTAQQSPGKRRTRQNTDGARGAVPADLAFYVYHRDGLPCRVCGSPVLLKELAGRNLFWCATCQT